ncbi:MAG: START domain-containing protein [Halobacteriovoraceae bacterium]|nr:START domain-containing protein [Halobacteriovoraceae bacterium]
MLFKISLLMLSWDSFAGKDNLPWKVDYKDGGITRYRTENDVKGMTPFKASMEMDIPYTKVLMAILNNKKSPDWSPRLIKAEILKRKKINKKNKKIDFLYTQFYRAPWPFINRQLLMDVSIKKIKNGVEFRGVKNGTKKYQNDDYIQASIHLLYFSALKTSENKCHATVIFIGDMGGWIPFWLIDIVQESWPTNFLLSLHKFAKSKENKESKNYLNVKKILSLH